MPSGDFKLVLPLAALFAAFFVAPLCVLIAMSLSTDAEMHGPTVGQYVKFFTDAFNYSILWNTIVLGVKATLLCLLFGYPIAWICSRGDAGDVVRLPDATKRRACDHRLLKIAAHDAGAVRAFGLDAARRNSIDPDFSRPQLHREGACYCIYRAFRPGIDRGLRLSRACN